MNRHYLPGVIALAALLVGCGDNPKCETLANHVADVVAKERPADMTAEIREKIVKNTGEACNAAPPEGPVLDCAIAATTSETIKACDSLSKGE